ncbi:MAG TPA: PQQ-binding-like beta-propeller repeat protein [Chthoniobacterales bacterium]|nr:PQQ-binding-like beta-propeller repeat protein [Chthoniobacterales bacterium]
MDKKTEISLRTGQRPPQPEAASAAPAALTATPTAASAAPTAKPAGQPPTGWWMYHGDPAHTGYVSDSAINSTNVNTQKGTVQPPFNTLFTLPLEGPVLSVPAVSNGFVYVGLANYQNAPDGSGNGGALHKIDITTGSIVQTFAWNLGTDTRDIHSFTGMGCTPAVAYGRVYFGAFNGKLYCLDEDTLQPVWVTDLRLADPAHNQPITNNAGVAGGAPAAVVWSSPVLSADGSKLFVGCGEGENPQLYSFVFCLDTATGNVNWIYCTNKFDAGCDNLPNFLPAAAVDVGTLPPQYTAANNPPTKQMGCSVWGAIAYDSDLNRIYCPTGNQAPEPNANWPGWNYQGTAPAFKPELPSPGYSNGVLALDADTGQFQAFFQVPPESNYRPSDIDIDVGGAPIIFMWDNGNAVQKAVGLGCKNGSFFVLDPISLDLLAQRQLLPYHNPPTPEKWIATVDPHPDPVTDSSINPQIPNAVSNQIPNENYSGVFNTPAVYPGSGDNPQTISPRIFFGMGGPNYHSQAPGIDYNSTPFMRAIDLSKIDPRTNQFRDAWPLDDGDPQRYVNTSFTDPNINTPVGMYTTAGESGISSPAVVNDVVFATTSKIAIYAFAVSDGTLLWYDDLGMQTDGYNGGYGFCLGPAIWKNFVVAGALVFGREGGGLLKIYGLPPQSTPTSARQ